MENEKNNKNFWFEDQTAPNAYAQKKYKHIINNEDTHRLVCKTDSIVDHVVDKFISRAKFGKQKYNNTMDRTDLSIDEWLEHAIEEHMDAILYLNKIKKELSGKI
jgi:hypothetical protein